MSSRLLSHRRQAADAMCVAIRKDGVLLDIDGDYTETLARISGQQDRSGRIMVSLSMKQHGQAEGRD